MAKTENFKMRITPDDKAVFEELARRLGRSQSDALRTVAHELVIALRNEETKKQTATHPAVNLMA